MATHKPKHLKCHYCTFRAGNIASIRRHRELTHPHQGPSAIDVGLRSSGHGILYPSAPSAFEIQAALLYELRSHGIHVRGEVNVGVGRRGRCDLVVFDTARQPYVVIEVKRKGASIPTTQQAFYFRLGIPCLYCLGMDAVKDTTEKVRAIKRSRAASFALKTEIGLAKS